MVLSLCTALGLHWAALQSVAWAGMLLSYSHSGSIASAVEKTFDGKHPCPLCKTIAKGEQGGKKQDYQFGNGKIYMDYRRPAVLLFPPKLPSRWPNIAEYAVDFFVEPSVPPPKPG